MRRGPALLLAALALCAAAPATPPARPVPTEEGFTNRMAERFRALLPDRDVVIVSPLNLEIRPRGGGEAAQIFVGRIFNICRNESQDSCDEEVGHFVRVISASTRDDAAAITRPQLRAAIRHGDYCAELQRLGATRADGERFLSRPLPPDLCEVLMVDYPDRMRALGRADLTALSLGEAEAWALGRRQALANLPRPPELEGLDRGVIAVMDHDYIPTLLLADDGWRALAAAQGPLLVAVPADEVMLLTRADKVGDMARFRTMVHELHRMGRRQISESVYRWTETGWTLLQD